MPRTPDDRVIANETEPLSAPAIKFRSRPRLQFSDASGARTIELVGDGILGSSPDSAVVVHHRTVSRVHAELSIRDDGLWVRDLDSRNGTYVNGVRITGALVTSSHPLRVGSVEIRLDYDDGRRTEIPLWPSGSFGDLLGTGSVMRELFALLSRVASSDATASIHGETGTGKELVARAIHDHSSRKEGPFVIVDCGAFSETLLDAELFGYAKGAFTGAFQAHAGAFESAHGGTVFLDEIGELPLSLQPKLLRVLESKAIRRLGEVHYRPIDVRVVSATHRDLARMVASGSFREDLYFRLGVLPVTVPPLRARREDIATLLAEFAKRPPHPFHFDEPTLRTLREWPWPGNVRELRNFVERAKVLGVTSAMRASGVAAEEGPTAASSGERQPSVPARTNLPTDLEARVTAMLEAPFRDFRDAWCEEGERRYLAALLARHHNDAVAAAKAAGVDKSYIYKIMRRLGIST